MNFGAAHHRSEELVPMCLPSQFFGTTANDMHGREIADSEPKSILTELYSDSFMAQTSDTTA